MILFFGRATKFVIALAGCHAAAISATAGGPTTRFASPAARDQAITDSSGRFRIDGMAPGTRRIDVYHAGQFKRTGNSCETVVVWTKPKLRIF